MPGVRHIALGFLLLLTPMSVQAQQVFVKNQPFQGKVIKDSSDLWLELAPLQKAFGFEATVEAEGARVEGRLLRVMRHGEVVLVPLSQIAATLGAVVTENPQFDTVDVHGAVRRTTSGGLEVETSPLPAGDTSAVEGEKIETAAFGFKLPEGMQVSRDPRLIRSFLQSAGAPAGETMRLDAMVHYKGDMQLKNGAAVFSWFSKEVPKTVQSEDDLLGYQYTFVTAILDMLGAPLVDTPRLLETAGQRFLLGAGVARKPPHRGQMVLMRIDAKRKRFYQVITANIPQTEETPTKDFFLLMSTVTTR